MSALYDWLLHFPWVIFSLSLLGFTGKEIYSWYRLSHIRGPFWASFSHLWIIRNILTGRTAEKMLHFGDYGSIVRIGPNYLLTSDPDVLRRMSSARSRYGRDNWYLGGKFDPHNDNVLSILDTEKHDKHKARLAAGYGGRDNVDIERTVDTIVEKLVSAIRMRYLAKINNNRPVDLSILVRHVTIDIITHLCYGKELGFLDSGLDLYSCNESAEKTARIFCLFIDVPILRWLSTSAYSPFTRLLRPKPTDESGFGKVMG